MTELKKLLEETVPENDRFDRYWSGKSKNSFCMKKLAQKNNYDSPSDYEYILYDYLFEHPSSPVYKEKRLRPFIVQWYRNAAEYSKEKDESEIIFPHFVIKDKTAELVKALHTREGISKQELSQRLGESTAYSRSVQNDLRRLSPSLIKDKRSRLSVRPLTIGGHAVKVNVRERRGTSGIKYYNTPSSVHPLVLLPNVSQTAVLLRSLAHEYIEKESDIALSVGTDVWLQLTDYCKSRIMTYFTSRDEMLDSFIDAIENDTYYHTGSEFVSEREMIENINNPEELILYAVKSGRPCRLVLNIDNETETYEKQKISIFKNCFRAESLHDSKVYIDFSADDLIDIIF